MLISKTYAKVILARDDQEYFYENLEILSNASLDKDFNKVLDSTLVSKRQKVEFLLSFIKGENEFFINFIKLLVRNHRLDFISRIFNELKREKSIKANLYSGKVYAKYPPTKDEIEDLEKDLGQKFNASIKLEIMKSDYDGLRITLDELGYELAFSMDKLQEKLKNYILQAL